MPIGDKVHVADPSRANPLADETEIEIVSPTQGRIARSDGFGRYGEPVTRQFDTQGKPNLMVVGGGKLVDDPKALAVSYTGLESRHPPAQTDR